MISFTLTADGILLVFYLVLLVRPAFVRRPAFFWIGAGGLGLAIFGAVFATITADLWARILTAIFGTVGALAAFGGALVACYGGKVPGVDAPAAQTTAGGQG